MYLLYYGGNGGELKNQQGHSTIRKIVLLHSIYFSIGFTIVYFALGFSASFIGKIFFNYNDVIRMFGGIFLVVMGTFMLDIFKPIFLMKEHRFQYTKKKVGFFKYSTILRKSSANKYIKFPTD
ncbi:cytochrome c biogenesis CcdA family protein [Bacillus sp. MRMR6]|uniref:cytochrome c biogenesis CcdA family protein n=1 Tax=Bacillus sp. MRMR6 TaxID=1928617 RepID=UPI0034C6A6C1